MNARPCRLAFPATLAVVLFAARPSDANAPAGQYTIGSGASAGTIYDTKSKLTWQQAAPAGTYTWANAKIYCTGLNLDGTGWRLPTVKALFSLVDRSQTAAPNIDSSAFPGAPSTAFWSSTLVAGSPSNAWYVHFYGGNTYGGAVSSTYAVRCVR